jgi:hypothetical protein
MKTGIHQHLEAWARTKGLQTARSYCRDVRDNIPWLNDETRQEFAEADGNEFSGRGEEPPKIAALHSSSALAVNFFDYWRHRDKSALASALGPRNWPITQIRFEEKFPTGIGPRSPNIDVTFRYDSGRLLAVESKFTEWLGHSGRKRLRDAYLERNRNVWAAVGLRGAQKVAEQYLEAGFDHLDVPQLLKHMLGLASQPSPWHLLLLWHRCDDERAPLMQDEIDRFRELLGTDGSNFSAMTYQQLWKRSAPAIRDEHPEYVEYITHRYFDDPSEFLSLQEWLSSLPSRPVALKVTLPPRSKE